MARLITLGILTSLLALYSAVASAGYIDYNGCEEGSHCYDDPLSDLKRSGGNLYEDPYSYQSTLNRYRSLSANSDHPWLSDDGGLDTGSSTSNEFDSEISTFISDFQISNNRNYSRSNYGAFNYGKTSGFKDTKLSYEDLERVKYAIEGSNTSSRGSRDLLESVVKKDAPKREKIKPPDFFSFEIIIAFHVLLFFIAFIFFKIDDRS